MHTRLWWSSALALLVAALAACKQEPKPRADAPASEAVSTPPPPADRPPAEPPAARVQEPPPPAVDPIEEKKAEYELRATRAKSEREWFELARWCKQQNLPDELKKAVDKVLATDPDHEEAHALLGQKYFEGRAPQNAKGRWLGADEYAEAERVEKEYREKGATDPWAAAAEVVKVNLTSDALFREYQSKCEARRPFLVFVEEMGGDERNAYHLDAKGDMFQALWDHLMKAYGERFKLTEPKKPFVVFVYKDRKGYEAHEKTLTGGVPHPNRRAHYDPRSRMVILYESDSRGMGSLGGNEGAGTVMHEGTHQVMHYLAGDRERKVPPYVWFQEGIAEYVGTVKQRQSEGEQRQWDFNQVNKGRLQSYQEAVKSDLFIPLEALLGFRSYEDVQSHGTREHFARRKRDKADFEAQYLLYFYAESWAFVYFLHKGADGKYQSKFLDYMAEEFDGNGGLDTFLKVFQMDEKQLAALEKEWKAFMATLK
jgi:hypothetical protein